MDINSLLGWAKVSLKVQISTTTSRKLLLTQMPAYNSFPKGSFPSAFGKKEKNKLKYQYNHTTNTRN